MCRTGGEQGFPVPDGPSIRLIASDMDGTLTGTDRIVPPETPELINALVSRGIEYVVVTGRRLVTAMEPLGPDLSHLHFVASNGAEVAHGTRRLRVVPFPRDLISRAVEVASRRDGVFCFVSTADGPHRVMGATPDGPYAAEIASFADYEHHPWEWATELPDDNIITFVIAHVIWTDDEVLADFSSFADEFTFMPATKGCIDTTLAGVDKGVGLSWLMESQGISPAEAVSFGDSSNDIPTGEAVGYSVAVANSRTRMLEAADYVIGSADQHAEQVALAAMIDAFDREGRLSPRGLLESFELAGWDGARPRP